MDTETLSLEDVPYRLGQHSENEPDVTLTTLQERLRNDSVPMGPAIG